MRSLKLLEVAINAETGFSAFFTSNARNGIPCPVLGSKELTKIT